ATCIGLVRESLPPQETYVLLGESFSGPVAISIAASQPRGLVGIILCATFASNPRPRLSVIRPLLPWLPFHGSGITLRLQRVLVLGRQLTGAARALQRGILETLPAATIRRRLEAVADCDVGELFKHIRVPILCVSARRDRLIPPAAHRLIQQYAPEAQ